LTSPARSSYSEAPIIALERAEKRYGGRVVLHVERLAIVEKELLVITGPNGSGKSTLLRLLAGLIPLSAGAVTRSPRFDSMRICYVPQTTGLYQHLTLADNIRLWTRLLGTTEPDDLSGRWYMRDFGLDRHLHSRCRELSGGYQRLAAIACAFAAGPDGIFMDEPFSGIDAEHSRLLLDGLSSARNDLNFVVITNHSAEGLPAATRVVCLPEAARQ
jgi:ABC-type multidrug transport system ATPase subunit